MTLPAPILRYHGGKFRIADWLIQHFPPHQVYVEPFGGGASVLLSKPPAPAEVYNDLDSEIVNLFRVLRDPHDARVLAQQCQYTPYAREEFEQAQIPSDQPIEQARRTLVRSWFSFGSAGATRGRTGMRTFTKPDSAYLGVAQAWSRVSRLIPVVTERLSRVVIEHRPAIDVMRNHDSPTTLHYVDPPYLPEPRSSGGTRYYRHELTQEDHEVLLDVLQGLTGMVLLSGYAHPLYDQCLPGWHRASLATSGSSRFGSTSRTECLWLNPQAQHGLAQLDLFDSFHRSDCFDRTGGIAS